MISILHPGIERTRATAANVVRALSWTLLVVGAISLTYAAYVISDRAVYQQVEIHKFETPTASSNSDFVAQQLRRHTFLTGEVIGEVQVSRIGLKAIVVEGDSPRILRRSVGHVPRTAFPGEAGNIALAGHRDSVFRPLQRIRQGDVVTFDVKERQFRYEVRSLQVVSPDDVAVLQPMTSHELTLITCFPFGFIGPAPNRLVVRAIEVESSPLTIVH